MAVKRLLAPSSAAALAVAVLCALPLAAFAEAGQGAVLALSEIRREEVPLPEAPEPAVESPAPPAMPAPVEPVPLPDPIQRFPLEVVPPAAGETPDAEPGDAEPPDGEEGAAASDEADPEIFYDISLLPEAVQRMRQLILDACRAGDIEALRPLLGPDARATQFSFGGIEGDPIAFLRGLSGDDQGQEILAILLEVLEAGYVHLDAGEPGEIYVWPYFFAVSLETLTPPQRVELFTIVTAGDYEEMKTYGTYNFYRVGISPEGEWLFFVAGD